MQGVSLISRGSANLGAAPRDIRDCWRAVQDPDSEAMTSVEELLRMNSPNIKKRAIVAIATRWGSEFGGINSFNADFLVHLRAAADHRAAVICVVAYATLEQCQSAQASGVRLISLLPNPPKPRERIDSSAFERAIRTAGLAELELVFVGHDRITGLTALELADRFGARSLLIHHMSYAQYESIGENSTSAADREEEQRRLFERADVVCAIGPLLHDSARDMLGGERAVQMLVPGLLEIPVKPAPMTFTGIVSGRLTEDAARIKLGHLAIAAFASAHRVASENRIGPPLLVENPRLIVRGVTLDTPLSASADSREWIRFGEKYADRLVNVHALPYTTDRQQLIRELSRASVALMPSWHEGFGLVAWEAIAAAIPLIVSKKSGVYKLLASTRGEALTRHVYPVDIKGRVDAPFFHDDDLRTVQDAILSVASDQERARERAAMLREAAQAQFTWRECCKDFLKCIGWDDFIVDSALTRTNAPAAESRSAAPQSVDSFLSIPKPVWRSGAGLAISQLLRAEEEVVPFDPNRVGELTELMAWATEGDLPDAVRLVIGGGGTGKTRLALELCKRLNAIGWHCGFVPAESDLIRARAAWRLSDEGQYSTLAVIDYAETKQETLLQLVSDLVRHRSSGKKRRRLLLIARDAGDWWENLGAKSAISSAMLTGPATSGPVQLRPLHHASEGRALAFGTAITVFAERLGVEAPALKDSDLSGSHLEHPLFLQMAALLALHGELAGTAEGLAKAVVSHERRYWSKALAEELPLLEEGGRMQLAAELMSLATLNGGVADTQHARRLWARWNASAAASLDKGDLRRVYLALCQLYAAREKLPPLTPDILGESLIASTLLAPDGRGLLDSLLRKESPSHARRHALTVLARMTSARADIQYVVVEALTKHFVVCAKDLMEVAIAVDSELPRWIEQAFNQLSYVEVSEVLGILERFTFHESVQLAEFAVALSKVQVERNRRRYEKNSSKASLLRELARSVENYAVDLSRAGRDSYDASLEAVGLHRGLHQSTNDPKSAASLSLSLINHGNLLTDQKRFGEALEFASEAIALLRLPATDVSRKQLAVALSNRAVAHRGIGNSEAALADVQAAVETLQSIAHGDVDAEAQLASALSILAVLLDDCKKFEEAAQAYATAIETTKRHASINPDRFRPDYALALINGAENLVRTSRRSDAVDVLKEGLELSRWLAQRNPARFQTWLASALSTGANVMENIGAYEASIRLATEQWTIAGEMLRRDPFRHRDVHANALLRLSEAMAANGQLREALQYSREAALEYVDLAVEFPRLHSEELFLAQWRIALIRWLLEPDCTLATPRTPSEEHCRSGRRGRLVALSIWLKACLSPHLREAEFVNFLKLVEQMDEYEFADLMSEWVCACSWLFGRGRLPLLARVQGVEQHLDHFLSQREGRVPGLLQAGLERLGVPIISLRRGD